jgi:hypothetical protein
MNWQDGNKPSAFVVLVEASENNNLFNLSLASILLKRS